MHQVDPTRLFRGRPDLVPNEFFPSAKTDADVRAVFDGLANGLNDALWSNWFALPMVDSMLCHIDSKQLLDGR
jgi:hypothetical protein